MNKSFLNALERIAKKENDGSSRHRFFIGLAYLNGIDVEINHEQALELLKSAAEDPAPCMEATEKLADMYLNGEGVERDSAKAIFWQRKLASQYKAAYDENHDPDEHKGYGTAFFKALGKLSDMYRNFGGVQAAIDTAKEALAFCEELEQEVGIREQRRDKALMLNRLGSLCRERGDLDLALDCYQKAGKIYEKLAAEIGTQRARRDLSISYERIGDIYRKQGDLSVADSYYQKAKDIRVQLMKEAESAGSRRDYSAVLTKLGNVRKSWKQYAEAAKYYGEALAIDRVLMDEVKSPQAVDDYGVSLVKMGDIHKAEGRMDEAADCYEQAYRLFGKNAEKTGSLIFFDHMAAACEKLASAKKKRGQKREAEVLYKAAVERREMLYAAGKTEASAHALAVSCYNAAAFLEDKEMMRRAYEIWKRLSEKRPEYGKYRDKAEKLSR